MAQQVEHFHGKEGVAGSNPAGSLPSKSRSHKALRDLFLFHYSA